MAAPSPDTFTAYLMRRYDVADTDLFVFDTAGFMERLRAPPILAAEFTVGGARRSAKLSIDEIDPARGSRTPVREYDVAGKREARALAKSLGATPWNF